VARRLNVILDVTSRCNLKCVMCYFANFDGVHFPPFERPQLSPEGNLPVEVFEKIASDLFPRAYRVALGCAAEPMIHPRFKEIVAVAGRYGVPDLWFPTNLLALTEPTMEALIRGNVATVAASIDGVRKETYEKIRVPAKWERLLACLEVFRTVKKRMAARRPRLRIIFTWMRSNRRELSEMPAFAEEHGATELDVRYVSPTVGVDVTPELLTGQDPRELNAELAAAARDAVRRGIRLWAYPDFEAKEDLPKDWIARVRRRAWRLRAGLDSRERLRHLLRQRLHGCAYPDRHYVIRPHGAVSPCIYWDQEPLGFYPADGLSALSSSSLLARIRDGLHEGKPIGTCANCEERRFALYRPRRPARVSTADRLPTYPR
jgi:MoaA/NifB/PqqE/SkfB family radical SAM enzyme